MSAPSRSSLAHTPISDPSARPAPSRSPSGRSGALAAAASPESLLRCIEAVLACRTALAANVKPKFAVHALVAAVGEALDRRG